MYMCVNTAVRLKLVSDLPLTPRASPEMLHSAQGWGVPPSASAVGRYWGMSHSGIHRVRLGCRSRHLQMEQPLPPPNPGKSARLV